MIIIKHFTYKTTGTCCRQIDFDLTDDKIIKNLVFTSGCNGNLKAIARLCEGKDAKEISSLLAGNTCGFRNTSCADQLSKAIEEALQ